MTGLRMTAARLLPTTVVGLILLFLAFPIIVVVVVSFSSATYLTFPPPASRRTCTCRRRSPWCARGAGRPSS